MFENPCGESRSDRTNWRAVSERFTLTAAPFPHDRGRSRRRSGDRAVRNTRASRSKSRWAQVVAIRRFQFFQSTSLRRASLLREFVLANGERCFVGAHSSQGATKRSPPTPPVPQSPAPSLRQRPALCRARPSFRRCVASRQANAPPALPFHRVGGRRFVGIRSITTAIRCLTNRSTPVKLSRCRKPDSFR